MLKIQQYEIDEFLSIKKDFENKVEQYLNLDVIEKSVLVKMVNTNSIRIYFIKSDDRYYTNIPIDIFTKEVEVIKNYFKNCVIIKCYDNI